MKQPDKCPKCGAEQEIPFNVYGYKCGTSCDGQVQSDLCKEWVLRIAVEVELAATKRALEEKRRDFDQAKTNAETNARLLNELTPRCLAAEARVAELEGLAIGNESEGDGGRWFEVFIPTERIGGANCEGEESPTLGDAMPRKG